jgi:hypothetical protein
MTNEGAKPIWENALIAVSLLGGLALLGLAWLVGDQSAAARDHQWELAFLGLALVLAGQWIVGGSPAAKKQQIAAAAAVFGLAGVAVQMHYHLGGSQVAPFIASYAFLFVAAELCFFLGRDWSVARRTVQYLRFGVVLWNVSWGVYYLSASFMQLRDIVNLYIAFSWLWTAATAIIGWSELCKIAEIAPDRTAPPTPPHDSVDLSSLNGRRA